jgi:hypothetical protein
VPHTDVLVANDFLDDLPDALRIMGAHEVSRAPDDDMRTRVTIDMPYVPEGALTVEPQFMYVRDADAVRIQSLTWTY